MLSLVGVVTNVTSSIVGGMATVNGVISNVTLLPAESVTAIVQSEYVPALKETKVIVLLSVVAEVVLEEQEPP